MKRIITAAASICLCLFFYGHHAAASTNGWEELILESNQAYKNGHFQNAVDGYNKLIRMGRGNGHIYYNLGNAYFKNDQLGYALLSYERARLFIPRDADLNYNLSHAYDQTTDVVSKSQSLINETFFWLDSITLNEIFRCFALLNVFLGLSILMHFVRKSEWGYYFLITILAGWLITGASFGLKWYQVKTDDRAVIVSDEVHVFAGPVISDTVLFNLYAGTIVRYERTETKWCLISLPDRKRGWVQANALERIKIQSSEEPQPVS